jgi:hypothetical protein
MGCKNWWWDTKEGERTTTQTPTLPFTPNPSPKKPNTLLFFFSTNSWYIDTYPKPRFSSSVAAVLLHLALRTDSWRKKRLLLRRLSIPGSKFSISNMVLSSCQEFFPTYSNVETPQHMLNLESSQQLVAMNNTKHHVKSNMIISAGATSKHNDQVSIWIRVFITTEYCIKYNCYRSWCTCDQLPMVQDEAVQKSLYPHDVNLHQIRRLLTLKAHALASSSGDEEEEILMERTWMASLCLCN